jgi:hypothetical protein
MISDHVYIEKVITLSLTADEWGLYHIDGRDDAADGLNKAVSVALNNFYKDVAFTKIEAALGEYSYWGANDTEGHAVVRQILDLFYK